MKPFSTVQKSGMARSRWHEQWPPRRFPSRFLFFLFYSQTTPWPDITWLPGTTLLVKLLRAEKSPWKAHSGSTSSHCPATPTPYVVGASRCTHLKESYTNYRTEAAPPSTALPPQRSTKGPHAAHVLRKAMQPRGLGAKRGATRNDVQTTRIRKRHTKTVRCKMKMRMVRYHGQYLYRCRTGIQAGIVRRAKRHQEYTFLCLYHVATKQRSFSINKRCDRLAYGNDIEDTRASRKVEHTRCCKTVTGNAEFAIRHRPTPQDDQPLVQR